MLIFQCCSEPNVQYRSFVFTHCLEFQSDDSVVDQGFDFELNVRYDISERTEWDQCFVLNTSMSTGAWHRWGRGTFSNGQCGVGITHKHRTAQEVVNIVHEIDGGNISNAEGVVDCTKKHSIGPEFCIVHSVKSSRPSSS